jgi:hypothetical protein
VSGRAAKCSALILVDPDRVLVGLAQTGGHLSLPLTALIPEDGRAHGPVIAISKARLGDGAIHASAYQDAALRALYEEVGQLIARPLGPLAQALQGPCWGRLSRHRLGPDRRALTYLGRAIDPTHTTSRRHIRIFAASVAKVSNSIKMPGRADRIAWMPPRRAADALGDEALTPFLILAPSALGGRPKPLLVRFRAGQRLETRL